MIIPVNGNVYTPQDALIYWIQERYEILIRKEAGRDKPWSTDPIFQNTYFCNVHRENDKVTRYLRAFYRPHVTDDLFEYNVVFSRFINWPDTIARVGYLYSHEPAVLRETLNELATHGKIWGNAYVITTHGIPMPKVTYLCENVLGAVYSGLERLRNACRGPSCAAAANALRSVEGIGDFLSGQIVADLKNTQLHPLMASMDRSTFVVPGPGSIRGLGWIVNGEPRGVSESSFDHYFKALRGWINEHWPAGVPPVDNQDLQNCLCEFDKYCRVATNTGRSKRHYAGK